MFNKKDNDNVITTDFGNITILNPDNVKDIYDAFDNASLSTGHALDDLNEMIDILENVKEGFWKIEKPEREKHKKWFENIFVVIIGVVFNIIGILVVVDPLSRYINDELSVDHTAAIMVSSLFILFIVLILSMIIGGIISSKLFSDRDYREKLFQQELKIYEKTRNFNTNILTLLNNHLSGNGKNIRINYDAEGKEIYSLFKYRGKKKHRIPLPVFYLITYNKDGLAYLTGREDETDENIKEQDIDNDQNQ